MSKPFLFGALKPAPMLKTKLLTLFTVTVLLVGALAVPLSVIQPAEALKSSGTYAKQYGSATKGIVCGDKLCSEVGKETPKKSQPQTKEEVKTEKKSTEAEKAKETPKKDTKEETMKQAKQQTMATTKTPKTVIKTITSSQDPGVGHESHQLAIILPPSENIYRGHITYSASEPIQLVALNGPLKPGMDKGQATWSPDGKTRYALTFVDNKNSAGVWEFSGNALAIHTMHENPFTVTYSVTYTENAVDNQKTYRGTITSSQDPGVGHESHQLAVILPPRDTPYRGHLTYDASEPIQLVALVGPIDGKHAQGQATWTPDGKTQYALILVDPKKSAGSWVFSGNALAIHSMNPDPFTVSYSVVLTE